MSITKLIEKHLDTFRKALCPLVYDGTKGLVPMYPELEGKIDAPFRDAMEQAYRAGVLAGAKEMTRRISKSLSRNENWKIDEIDDDIDDEYSHFIENPRID